MPAIDLKHVLEETTARPYGDLVTRRTGKIVRAHVEGILDGAEGESVTVIDFSSVRLLDLSCADEIVAKLLLTYGRARPFLFRGVCDGHCDAIEPVLERHRLAAVAQDSSGRLRVLGLLSDEVRRVFTWVAERGSAEVDEVTEHLALSSSAARAALDELVERRLALSGPTGLHVVSLA